MAVDEDPEEVRKLFPLHEDDMALLTRIIMVPAFVPVLSLLYCNPTSGGSEFVISVLSDMGFPLAKNLPANDGSTLASVTPAGL
jgi:hypothetical protein